MEEKLLEKEWLFLCSKGLIPENCPEEEKSFYRLLFYSGAVSIIGLLAISATFDKPTEKEISKGISIQRELEEFIFQDSQNKN